MSGGRAAGRVLSARSAAAAMRRVATAAAALRATGRSHPRGPAPQAADTGPCAPGTSRRPPGARSAWRSSTGGSALPSGRGTRTRRLGTTVAPVAAGALAVGVGREMDGEKLGQERRQVGCADRPVLRAAPVEPGLQLIQLPVDVERAGADAFGRQARDLTPPHPGVGHRDHHHEVGVGPGQHRAPLSEEQSLCRSGSFLESCALPPLAPAWQSAAPAAYSASARVPPRARQKSPASDCIPSAAGVTRLNP
jgi:hypothetical protein